MAFARTAAKQRHTACRRLRVPLGALAAIGAIQAIGCNAILGLDASELREADGGPNDASARSDAPVGTAGADSGVVGTGTDADAPRPDAAGDAGFDAPSATGDGGCEDPCSAGAMRCGGGGIQTCSSSVACAPWTTTACASRTVCERYEGPTCEDPTWAQWPVGNSQVDVQAGAPNMRGFTDNHDGTVTDKVTGLMWQQKAPVDTYTQSAGVSYCQSIALGGFHDWRLPSLIELFSIVDTGVANPSVDDVIFPSTPVAGFWSATPLVGALGWGWGITFDYGAVGTQVSSDPNNVRCVR